MKVANDLFGVVSGCAMKVETNQTYALKNVGQAYRVLENPETKGLILFMI